MKRYIEGEACKRRVAPSKEPWNDDKVCGARDRNEFSQALDDSKYYGLNNQHVFSLG